MTRISFEIQFDPWRSTRFPWRSRRTLIRRGGLKWRVSNPYNSESVKGEREDGAGRARKRRKGARDDGVNDAWYKSECGQACGFGGEKFKWLVRMVLLYLFVPRSTSAFSLPLSLSSPSPPLSIYLFLSQSTDPFDDPATFRTSTTRISPATRYRS